MNKAEEDRPIILVYGIDRVGYTVRKDNIETRLCVLHFESFNTREKFQDYDGVILFQGIFEEIERHTYRYGRSYTTIECCTDELQRRKKQYELLMGKKGFICFLLIAPFIDRAGNRVTRNTDLAKWALNRSGLYREDIAGPETSLRTVRNEFIDFLKQFGAAYTKFSCHDDALELKEICKYGTDATGIILRNREYFVPTLEPKKYETEEFLKILAEALISTHKKLSEEIPDWANQYKFEEEKQLIEKGHRLQGEIDKIDQRILQFREYKKCICYNDELLRESIIEIFRDGFDLKIDDTDEFKEDFKIIDNEGKPVILVEVKGTNKGITRQHINQTDSHRERAELDQEFPSILIVNTNIKKSNSLRDKYQKVAKEQIKHAVKMNVLVMRAIDFLNMHYLKEKGEVKKKNFVDILRQKSGWLEASQESWSIRKE